MPQFPRKQLHQLQSAAFVERHGQNATNEISIYGVEKDRVTVNLNKMNLAVHGLSGDVREANTYSADINKLFPRVFSEGGGFDFVMANPPFNVSGVRKDDLEGDWRFPYGIPKPDNANYLWIQLFHSALNDRGRAGFVMANSAGDARGSEQLIRQRMIEDGSVDVIVSIGSNFFYTVTLPCTRNIKPPLLLPLPSTPPAANPGCSGGHMSQAPTDVLAVANSPRWGWQGPVHRGGCSYQLSGGVR